MPENRPLIPETLVTFGRYVVYIALFAMVLILLRAIFRIPKDIFRKLLHIAAFTSSIFVVLTGENWIADTLTLVLFAAVVYPVLSLAEHWSGFGGLFVEKKPGEVRNSLLLLFLSQAVFVALSCGLIGKPYIVIASTAAWGLGDIAAAWVGRPYGKHKIRLKIADPAKSWEGSAAMAAVSALACFTVLLSLRVYPVTTAVFVSLAVGVVSAFAEMCSRGGMDTVTVPAADVLLLWVISLLP